MAGQQCLQHLAADRRELLRPRRADPFGMHQRVRGTAVVIMVGRGKSRFCRGHFRQFVAFRAAMPKPGAACRSSHVLIAGQPTINLPGKIDKLAYYI